MICYINNRKLLSHLSHLSFPWGRGIELRTNRPSIPNWTRQANVKNGWEIQNAEQSRGQALFHAFRKSVSQGMQEWRMFSILKRHLLSLRVHDNKLQRAREGNSVAKVFAMWVWDSVSRVHIKKSSVVARVSDTSSEKMLIGRSWASLASQRGTLQANKRPCQENQNRQCFRIDL